MGKHDDSTTRSEQGPSRGSRHWSATISPSWTRWLATSTRLARAWRRRSRLDGSCRPAWLNFEWLQAAESGNDLWPAFGSQGLKTIEPTPQHGTDRPSPIELVVSTTSRVAILSFLFNWPSIGGGNIHTVELATFLARAGYDVRH